MEHCTTRFFETCDLDNDKYIALDEWAGCFGIKESEYLCKGTAVLSLFFLSALSVICVPILPSVPGSLQWALPAWVGLAVG